MLGHKGGVNLFSDWFPIYSFHMPLFIFISGYFYKESSELNLIKFILRKIRTLVIPYFIWNAIYGIFANVLKYNDIIYFTDQLSIKSLFIEPWISGHQFSFNISGWFVLALFLVQVLYVLIRKSCTTIRVKDEYTKLFVFMIIGVVGVILANKGYTDGFKLSIVRVMFLIPFYHIGYIYNKRLECKDNIPNIIYFSLLFLIQFLLIKKYGNLEFSAVWCNQFNKENILLPYITSITGIMFWLRVSRVLLPSTINSKVINYIGNNTWTVMMHHYFGFFILNVLFAVLASILGLEGFIYEEFKGNILYTYIPGSEFIRIFYIMSGIGIPLGIKYILELLKIKNGNVLKSEEIKIFA